MSGKVYNQRFVNSCLANSPSVYCPRRDLAQKAKSQGGTLAELARMLRKVLTVEIYNQYLDLLEQGPRGIGK